VWFRLYFCILLVSFCSLFFVIVSTRHGEYRFLKNDNIKLKNKHVGPPYCWAEMYAGRVACCPLVSHGEYADGTDGRMDARPLHYASS